MVETLASRKMKEIDLLNNLEKISSFIPNRILKVEGYILNKNQKEQLEIISYKNPNRIIEIKGFIIFTTQQIEIDL